MQIIQKESAKGSNSFDLCRKQKFKYLIFLNNSVIYRCLFAIGKYLQRIEKISQCFNYEFA